MKAFKLFLKVLNNKKTTFIATFLIFLGIFNFLVHSANVSQEVILYDMKVVVFDHDQSDLSKALTDYLEENNVVAEVEEDEQKINDAIFGGQLDYALVIPEGFQEKMDQGVLMDTPTYVGVSESSTKVVDTQINTFLAIYDNYRLNFGGKLEDKDRNWILEEMKVVMESEVEGSIAVSDELDNAKETMIFLTFLRLLPYPLVSLGFSIIGTTVTSLEKAKMKRRDLISGYPESKRTLQMFLAAFVCMLVIWFLLVASGAALNGINPFASKAMRLLVATSFTHVLATSSLVLLFAHLFPTKAAMSFLSTLLSLMVSFSTGVFVPRSFVWKPLLELSKVTPSYWDISNISELIGEGLSSNSYDMGAFRFNIMVMALMAVVGLLVTMVIRKSRNQEA